MVMSSFFSFFFFFNDTATTEIYTLSLHDALPIYAIRRLDSSRPRARSFSQLRRSALHPERHFRSEEHTSELQSRLHLVCRLLLEKKKKLTEIAITDMYTTHTPLSSSTQRGVLAYA